MNLYQIDFKRLVLLLLPVFLRRPALFAFCTALTFSVSELHARFLKNSEANRLRIRRNGQTCYLRGALNDELDADERRITITDGFINCDWVFAYSETIPPALIVDADTLVYSEAAIIQNTSFFIITVPWTAADVNATNRLRSLVNEYKLLSKQYRLVYAS